MASFLSAYLILCRDWDTNGIEDITGKQWYEQSSGFFIQATGLFSLNAYVWISPLIRKLCVYYSGVVHQLGESEWQMDASRQLSKLFNTVLSDRFVERQIIYNKIRRIDFEKVGPICSSQRAA